MTPFVSIITPLYNKAAYIGETIASVLAQTFADWELLVVDNNSTDGGPALVRAIPDKRVKLLSCTKRGASAARNAGLDAARGEWAVFLDADDMLRPDYVESQLAAAKRAPDANLVVCSYEEFVEGAPEKTVIKHALNGELSKARLLDSAIVYAPGPTHLFLIARGLVGSALRWPENLDTLLGEDAYFWFVVLNEAIVAFNPLPLARYRFLAPGSRFTTLSDAQTMFTGLHAAITENIQYLAQRDRPVTAGQAEFLMRFYGGLYLESQRTGKSELTAQALHEASRWLGYCLKTADHPRIALRLRSWLGLPAFTKLFHRI